MLSYLIIGKTEKSHPEEKGEPLDLIQKLTQARLKVQTQDAKLPQK